MSYISYKQQNEVLVGNERKEMVRSDDYPVFLIL